MESKEYFEMVRRNSLCRGGRFSFDIYSKRVEN